MKQSYRKIIYKIPMLYKLCKIIVDFNNLVYFKFSRIGKYGNREIKELKNSQQGKRCFIIGNGPSLKATDLDKLINEDCFGMNYIFKIFDQTKWRPKYYLTQDKYIVNAMELEKQKFDNMFIGAYYFRKNKPDLPMAICYYHESLIYRKEFHFSDDCSKKIYDCGTVTYAAIQFAAYMGYSEIYLLGMDTNFALTINEKGDIERNDVNNNHFYKDNNPSSIIANQADMLKGYVCAKKFSESHNFKIYNATRGGKLEVFERVDFDKLFNN